MFKTLSKITTKRILSDFSIFQLIFEFFLKVFSENVILYLGYVSFL